MAKTASSDILFTRLAHFGDRLKLLRILLASIALTFMAAPFQGSMMLPQGHVIVLYSLKYVQRPCFMWRTPHRQRRICHHIALVLEQHGIRKPQNVAIASDSLDPDVL